MDLLPIPTPKRKRLIKQMFLFVEAKPLSRPRFRSLSGTKQIYTPLENQAEMMSELTIFKPLGLKMPLIVDTYFYFAQRGEDLFPTSNKFGDEDNLRKAVNDNLVRADILDDDRWVVGGETYKYFDKEPATVIMLWEAGV